MSTVAHLTSAHPRFDTRIFIKQCRLLARHGFEVALVVADGLGPAVRDGVRIHDVGRESGRLARMLRTTTRVLEQAARLDADIYHLHDPELIPAGLRLKRLGKTVLFDAHEDVPLQVLGKTYLPRLARRPLAAGLGAFERFACARFDGIVAATPSIRDKFLRIHPNTVDVNNYPVVAEFAPAPSWDGKASEVCYVGSIAAIRGIREMLAACALLRSGARLNLAGSFEDAALEADVRGLRGWERVNWLGQLDRGGVAEAMRRSIGGLVTLHKQPNYLDALPVKMFEYMAAGIPVIASDIPLWRAIVEGHACGLCVDPLDPGAIAQAIDFLAGHPAQAEEMGRNGRRAVEEHYNWQRESDKLLALYARLARHKRDREGLTI
jgi:glycosyltransferase involved in cell wall biosynthesis